MRCANPLSVSRCNQYHSITNSLCLPPYLPQLQKPVTKMGFRGRGGGRLGGYKKRGRGRGRAKMMASHQQRVAKKKVIQAKYHSMRGAHRRGRGLRKRGRPRRQPVEDDERSAPPLEPLPSQEEEAIIEPVLPKLTPISIPALEPEVVLMEKAQPSVVPMYVVRPAPISPPPSTVTLEDNTEHVITHDVWIKIFQYLPPKELCKCMRVCKTWNRWCCNPLLWRCLSIARMSPISATALRGLVLRQPRSLDISWTNISRQHFVWLLARLPGLRTLYLHGISWDAVTALCSSICPVLRLLDLRWVTGIKDASLKRLLSPINNHRPGMIDDHCHLRFLTDLRLTGSDITDASMATLRDCTPQLAKLNLQRCRKITDEGVRILAGDNSPMRNTLRGK